MEADAATNEPLKRLASPASKLRGHLGARMLRRGSGPRDGVSAPPRAGRSSSGLRGVANPMDACLLPRGDLQCRKPARVKGRSRSDLPVVLRLMATVQQHGLNCRASAALSEAGTERPCSHAQPAGAFRRASTPKLKVRFRFIREGSGFGREANRLPWVMCCGCDGLGIDVVQLRIIYAFAVPIHITLS